MMKRNIFTKSTLRQTVRSALLGLLLMVSAFLFVMRSVEYIVINEQISEISGFFRPVGFLGHPGDYFMNDVRPSAEIVSSSPYVDFNDRRRLIEAVLLDMPNTGSVGNFRGSIGRDVLTPEDAFFYGTLTQIRHGGDNPYIVLTVDVDHVMLGYPEHVIAGKTLEVHYFMDINEMQAGHTAIDGMAVGERYFLRGVFYSSWIAPESGVLFPFSDVFVMHPLCGVVYTYPFGRERDINRDGVWYAPATLGEPVDLLIPGLENLYDELHWIRFSLSRVKLKTTVDMSYIPLMQPQSGARAILVEGRWVNREDNELSRPVVAVHQTFAEMRGLSIGDTLRIGIPPEQRLFGSTGYWGDGYLDMSVVGEVFAPFAYILELEIVGTFDFANTTGMLGSPMATTIIYMPDSALPPDVTLDEFEFITSQGGETVTVTAEEGFISPEWYSFVLNDPRDADAFVLENREALGALGFSIEFMPGIAGAQAFWESAESILQTVSFNLVLFSFVAGLVLMLAGFLYLKQRYRDYAVLRALGNPALKTNRQLISTFLLLALPTTILGGTGGWILALNEATRTLEALPDTAPQAEIGLLWLPLLIGVVLTGTFIIAILGAVGMGRRSALEMLQGTVGIKRTPEAKSSTVVDINPYISKDSCDKTGKIISADFNNPTQKSTKSRRINNSQLSSIKSQLKFIIRHITRQRVKTVLASAIALLFVLALAYLQTTIESTESEIDHLYDTTIVTGEIRQANLWDNTPGRLHNNVVRAQTIADVAPLVINELITACHEFAVFTAVSEDGSLPENWDEIAGININAHLTDNINAFDTLVGINDLERFVEMMSQRADEMLIDFKQGFYLENFVFSEGSSIPVLVPYHIMEFRGYELGETIYISTSTILRSLTWNHTPVVIVGTHNRNQFTNQIRDGVLMPVEALEYIVGDELRYTSMRFEIDPTYNREMTRIQDEIAEITEHIGAGEVELGLFLDDEELRLVVIPMEQNLSLLRLLYPVAIVLSAIIGLGLSVLLMLQNAKTAAIMRVLGTSKRKTRTTLSVEQMMICLFGLALGLILLTVIGWGFGFVSSLVLAGVYFAGATAGTVAGTVIITNKAPLELLQVKE